MNRLLLLAALIIAAPALADDEKKVPVKRVDASTPILQAVQDPATDVDDVASARAQDYNSSRSNNESTRAASGNSCLEKFRHSQVHRREGLL